VGRHSHRPPRSARLLARCAGEIRADGRGRCARRGHHVSHAHPDAARRGTTGIGPEGQPMACCRRSGFKAISAMTPSSRWSECFKAPAGRGAETKMRGPTGPLVRQEVFSCQSPRRGRCGQPHADRGNAATGTGPLPARTLLAHESPHSSHGRKAARARVPCSAPHRGTAPPSPGPDQPKPTTSTTTSGGERTTLSNWTMETSSGSRASFRQGTVSLANLYTGGRAEIKAFLFPIGTTGMKDLDWLRRPPTLPPYVAGDLRLR
jgi:hypothetical protein